MNHNDCARLCDLLLAEIHCFYAFTKLFHEANITYWFVASVERHH